MSAFYIESIFNHQIEDSKKISGIISSQYFKYHPELTNQQNRSWEGTINILKNSLTKIIQLLDISNDWKILYEYKIPRRNKRIDIAIISPECIFIIEVKYNENKIYKSDIIQLEDYCLDLRDFHLESKNKSIIPILLCSNTKSSNFNLKNTQDFVKNTISTNSENLADVILKTYNYFKSTSNETINIEKWNTSEYYPTPTIIESAQRLYSNNNVSEIARNQAGIKNLENTTEVILDAIKTAEEKKTKIICFITGVPGAGKTLAGLNIVHNKDNRTNNETLGVFLSGNSPLVKVLSEALARDTTKQNVFNKKEALRNVKTFIQNVHEYIDEYYKDTSKIPVDNILIYDEAQRAWTKEHKSRKSFGEIKESEPEILLSILNRLDWGVLIALIGNGQEINTGEAGLPEWGRAIIDKFSHWTVFISPLLSHENDNNSSLKLFEKIPESLIVQSQPKLHLEVSLRSYKAAALSDWVSLVLDNQPIKAHSIFIKELNQYPIYITRSISDLKRYLKSKSRGTRRTGLVASSGGRRLKSIGFDPFNGLRGDSSQDELGNWYLNPNDDIRSSNFLEVVATEYAVQGLEIDWAGVLWDCDLRRLNNNWDFKQFKGTKWQFVKTKQQQQYMLNKYRVLLTRAREGMVIFVPYGDLLDETRLPSYYDETFEYLKSCGLKGLEDVDR